MLLDEPLSNLDALLRVELRTHSRTIHRALGCTGIYVTRDQMEAFRLGTGVAVMGAGRVVQFDTASNVYQRPATDYVARFLGIRNSLARKRDNGWVSDAGRLDGNLPALDRQPGPLQIFLRPEALRLSVPDPSPQEAGRLALAGGRVVEVLYSGGEVDYLVSVGGVSLFVTKPVGLGRFGAGDAVTVSFAGKDALLYANGVLVKD